MASPQNDQIIAIGRRAAEMQAKRSAGMIGGAHQPGAIDKNANLKYRQLDAAIESQVMARASAEHQWVIQNKKPAPLPDEPLVKDENLQRKADARGRAKQS
jgi:hypothetical protein